MANSWEEEVRDSFVPATPDTRTIGKGSRLPSSERMGSVLGIRIGGEFVELN